MIDLHCHSTYSFRDGLGTLDQIYARMEELGREVMCLTEHDNIYSAVATQHTKPENLKAIFGCEIRTVQNIESMRENKQRKKNHLTLLSKSPEGYGNLCKLVTFANLEGHYYFPTIDFDVFEKYKKDIIVLSGCPSSYLYELILSDRVSEAIAFCKRMKTNLDGNFYLEVMPHDLEMVHKATPFIRAISKRLDIPMVLTNDTHFLNADQAKIWKLMRAIRLNTTVNQIDDALQSCYYMTDDEAWEHAKNNLGQYFSKKELLELFNNQEKIASDCNVIIPKIGSADSGSENPFDELRERTYQGLIDKGLDKPEYRTRLEKELDLVGRKNFADYFLVVSDLVRWCKTHDILVGPSRGSAGGFLTSYCIDIIDLDPIPHDLVMERFLSEERVDPPDIDIDFQSKMRDAVILHMQEVYGDKNVAHIITFQHYKGKNTLIDVGKAYGIPPYEVKKVSNVLLERGRADARASATIEDTFYEFQQAKEVAEKYPGILDAIQLEGLIRHAGVNAAGVLVTKRPLDIACSLNDKEGKWVASVDLEGAYSLDILKLDILAIKELDILKELCENTDVDENEIFHLPLDDRSTLDVFEGDTLGVFQFGATGTSSLIKQLTPINSFGDIVLCNALSRPGPLHSGQSASITKAKSEGSYSVWNTGVESVDNILNNITKDTYGFMVFQEQIMRAMKEVGDFTWEQVASIRNAMSKSLGDEYFNKFRQSFIEGSFKLHGLSDAESNDIFDHAIHFGNWAFNRAHSVGYSLISFATAYFKAHHPREFYRSLCNFNSDDKLKSLLREYIEKGYGKILPPKIGKSGEGWTIEGDDLRGGLKDVIPEKACQEILSLYPIKDADDLLKRAQRRKVNKRVWEIIESNELFSDNDNLDPYGLYEFAKRMSRIKDRTHRIADLGYSFQFRDVIIAGVMDRQFNEKSYAELMQSQKTKDFSYLKIEEYGDSWGIMSLLDETGIPINVHFKNKTYPQFRDWIWNKKEKEDIIVVKGLIPPNMNYVIVKDAWDGEECKADGARCIECSLIDSIFVPPIGNENANIMLLGMAPGREEAEAGEPFVGAAGRLLSELLIKAGTRRDKLWITNSCLCRSTTEEDKNRDPTDEEISCCNERLMREIDQIQPKVIITLGKLAYKALTGEESTVGSVDGKVLEWGDFTVIPTYHPASCLYSDADTKRMRIKQAIESAIKLSRELS